MPAHLGQTNATVVHPGEYGYRKNTASRARLVEISARVAN